MAAPAGSGSRLLSIPLEILLQIARHLTTPEYGNLRLTCKHLEASVFNAFSREFFRKKQFMLTHFSLQALVDISNSRLADGLSHVIMGIERPSLRPLVNPHLASDIDSPPPELHARVKFNKLRGEYNDHLTLLESGHDIEMMAQAFTNLKNLETIEIRDFSSNTRFRDGFYSTWRSYGTATYEESTGGSMLVSLSQGRHFDEKTRYIGRLFQNMLRALGRTNTRPKRFEVNLRYSGLEDNAFKIQKYDEPTVLPVLAKLESLFLDLKRGDVPVFVASQDQSNAAIPCFSYHLQRFLARISEIQHLRLNFEHFGPTLSREFITWLSEAPTDTSSDISASELRDPLPCAPPPVLLKNIRLLGIGKAVLDRKGLLAVLQKHKETLRGLDLHRVVLVDSSEPHVRVNEWAKFFGGMGKLDLGINHMSLCYLSQEKGRKRTDRKKVVMKDCPAGRRIWEGQDLNGALKDLVGSVVVEWPDENTESSHEDTDDSEDDSLDSDDVVDLIGNAENDEGETSDSDGNSSPLFIPGSVLALSNLPIYSILGPP